MSIILITGGTGMVGTALTKMLVNKGHQVIILSRSPKISEDKSITYANWDVTNNKIDEKSIAEADYVIHLAGAGVADKRWTTARKTELVESRTLSSALLVKALATIPNKVKAVISASAIGWYGGDELLKGNNKYFIEEMLPDRHFLGETCRLWEDSIRPVEKLGIRLVKLRLGIVLSNEGGAFVEFKKPVKFGLAAILGSGKQIISWIHIEDVCRMFVFAIENEQMQGAYNAVAPMPITNQLLTLALAKKMKGKFFVSMNIPAFILKLMLGEMSIEVLKSTKVSSEKIRNAGFTFLYPSITAALAHL